MQKYSTFGVHLWALEPLFSELRRNLQNPRYGLWVRIWIEPAGLNQNNLEWSVVGIGIGFGMEVEMEWQFGFGVGMECN